MDLRGWGGILDKCCEIRAFETCIQNLYHTDIVQSPVHLSLGQELISVLAARFSTKCDHVVGNYRSHALSIAFTKDLDLLILELCGKKQGVFGGRAGSMHLGDPDSNMPWTSAIVGTGVPVALGLAASLKLDGKGDRLVTVQFGDGAFEEGCVLESLNAASAMRLLIVFLLEDNGLAIYSRKEARTHPKTDYVARAKAFNIKSFGCSMLDPQSVYKTFKKAYSFCRKNQIPVFIHVSCYRWCQHVGVEYDWKVGYRNPSELAPWLDSDIISNPAKIGLEKEYSQALYENHYKKILSKFLSLSSAEDPSPSTILRHVY